MKHDHLCPCWEMAWSLCLCSIIKRVRDDERDQMQIRAASVIATSHDDGTVTLLIDDPDNVGWTPISLELLKGLIDRLKED